jgi:hypothetical protein
MRLLLSAGPGRPAIAAEWVDIEALGLSGAGFIRAEVASSMLDDTSILGSSSSAYHGAASTRYGRSSAIAGPNYLRASSTESTGEPPPPPLDR